MANIKFGCEVYTWFMDEWGVVWDDKLDHMMGTSQKAGFVGIEPMHFWMGSFTDPAKLRAARALVLPGDGAFAAAMEHLQGRLKDLILEHVTAERPMLGVCIGFQVLFIN